MRLVDFVAQQSQGLQRHVVEENKINKFPKGPLIKTVICYIANKGKLDNKVVLCNTTLVFERVSF